MILKNLAGEKCLWLDGDTSSPFISTRVRYARNLAGRIFPNRAVPSDQRKIRESVMKGIDSISAWENCGKIRMEDLDVTDRRLLMERHLASYDLVFTERAAGMAVAEGATMSMMINEEDHIRLQVFDKGLKLNEAYSAASTAEKELSGVFDFAQNDDFGFLTACPTNAGTGLRISFLVHLPALSRSGYIGELMGSLGRLGVVIRGFYGEATSPLGDFFQVSNQVTLGISGSEIIDKLTAISTQIEEAERKFSAELFKKANTETRDRIYRSYGVLTYARKLSYTELMACVSDVRFGLREGMAIQADGDRINDLVMLAQPAHIEERAESALSEDERDPARAEFAREVMGR